MLGVLISEEEIEVEIRHPEEQSFREVKHQRFNVRNSALAICIGEERIRNKHSKYYKIEELDDIEKRIRV